MRFFSKRSYAVFELVNERLHEIYVGRTSDIPLASDTSERRSAAPTISHWNPDDVRPPRSIEFDLSETDAERFIAAYVHTPLPQGWRFVS